ncbi:MAG: CDP-alcohol phosphatidyltransferase family protein [Phycisphaeraceae bacterium]
MTEPRINPKRPSAPASAVWTLATPTLLSSVRVVMAAIFPWVGDTGRLWCVVASAVSDGLDGIAARQLGAATWWGGMIDGLTDKAFVAVALVTFGLEERLASWQIGLLLTRDVVVLIAILTMTIRRQWNRLRRLPARMLGKLTTVALFTLIACQLAWPRAELLNRTILIITIPLSIAAAIDYLLRFGKEGNEDEPG